MALGLSADAICQREVELKTIKRALIALMESIWLFFYIMYYNFTCKRPMEEQHGPANQKE
ncbi:Uncharacterised protein [Legionella longbeachae]|uniref:Uncharacterized protein n=1 Tax=Legionella oakridgensis TaxID=29423 RepID=A0A0W0XHG7_9GAMM|nr:hypothetical protein Loak_0217 [Legionella oakridgensis]STY20843.1 Uncharacterised protein [Legionella longbeachae]